VTVRFLVHGRVQGVGFRWFTAREAVRLGLGGAVRNLPDGRVEVVASGSAEAVGAMEVSLRRGPRAAIVTKVEKEEISDEAAAPSDFIISD